jgi:dihydroorotate dehydrogenase
MLYALARPLLFALDAERSHELGLALADSAARAGLLRPPASAHGTRPVRVMGIDFPNRVGLAAGLDKDGRHVDALAAFGFGFIEVGTVTPRPQPGNPRPRLFRLPEAGAIINRFGFNSAGLDAMLASLAQRRWRGVLGINIGKNFATPLERAADDYALALDRVHAAADYVTVNISSPNTAGLRQLQDQAELDSLLARLANERARLADRDGRRVPLALKVAPDLDEAAIRHIAAAVRRHRIDALIATNTSTTREGVAQLRHADESGGLSGAPIRARSLQVLKRFAGELGGEVPLIGVGGIQSGLDAAERIAAGASLVQLYTGLIYRGPGLVDECLRRIA